MDKLRKQSLEQFSKSVEEGLPFAEDFIKKSSDIEDNALLARNLSEQALAQQVLKNTGVPIPNKVNEDFLAQIMKERYPEMEPNIRLSDVGGAGEYGKGQIDLNKYLAKNQPIENTVGTMLHEAGHQYDDQILGQTGKNLDLKTLRDLKASGMDLKNADPAQVYEMYAKGHHSNIPNLREGSFGLGALKSYLKSGTFKALPLVGPAVGVAAALDSGDASAAVPVLGEADSVGESPEEEKMMLNEISARKNYDNSPAAADAKRAALTNLLKK